MNDDRLYRFRYVGAFGLIVLAATALRAADMLGSVEYASLVGGCYITLCGGGALNTKVQGPVKQSTPPTEP